MIKTEGQRLLCEYLKTGRTRSQIAKAIGKSKPTIGAWADGRYIPDIGGAIALEDFAGVPARAWSEKPKRKSQAA